MNDTLRNYNFDVSYSYSHNGEYDDKRYQYTIKDFNKLNPNIVLKFATTFVHSAVPAEKMKHFAEVNYTKFELFEEGEDANVYTYRVVEPCTD